MGKIEHMDDGSFIEGGGDKNGKKGEMPFEWKKTGMPVRVEMHGGGSIGEVKERIGKMSFIDTMNRLDELLHEQREARRLNTAASFTAEELESLKDRRDHFVNKFDPEAKMKLRGTYKLIESIARDSVVYDIKNICVRDLANNIVAERNKQMLQNYQDVHSWKSPEQEMNEAFVRAESATIPSTEPDKNEFAKRYFDRLRRTNEIAYLRKKQNKNTDELKKLEEIDLESKFLDWQVGGNTLAVANIYAEARLEWEKRVRGTSDNKDSLVGQKTKPPNVEEEGFVRAMEIVAAKTKETEAIKFIVARTGFDEGRARELKEILDFNADTQIAGNVCGHEAEWLIKNRYLNKDLYRNDKQRADAISEAKQRLERDISGRRLTPAKINELKEAQKKDGRLLTFLIENGVLDNLDSSVPDLKKAARETMGFLFTSAAADVKEKGVVSTSVDGNTRDFAKRMTEVMGDREQLDKVADALGDYNKGVKAEIGEFVVEAKKLGGNSKRYDRLWKRFSPNFDALVLAKLGDGGSALQVWMDSDVKTAKKNRENWRESVKNIIVARNPNFLNEVGEMGLSFDAWFDDLVKFWSIHGGLATADLLIADKDNMSGRANLGNDRLAAVFGGRAYKPEYGSQKGFFEFPEKIGGANDGKVEAIKRNSGFDPRDPRNTRTGRAMFGHMVYPGGGGWFLPGFTQDSEGQARFASADEEEARKQYLSWLPGLAGSEKAAKAISKYIGNKDWGSTGGANFKAALDASCDLAVGDEPILRTALTRLHPLVWSAIHDLQKGQVFGKKVDMVIATKIFEQADNPLKLEALKQTFLDLGINTSDMHVAYRAREEVLKRGVKTQPAAKK